MGPLEDVADLLVELRAPDVALDLIGLYDPENRLRAYARLLQITINRHDRDGVAKLLPPILAAVQSPPKYSEYLRTLSLTEFTQGLAIGGFRDEARQTYAIFLRWDGVGDSPSRPEERASLKVYAGDVAVAMQDALAEGAMTVPRNPARAEFAAAMALAEGTPGHVPTLAEVDGLAKQVLAKEPPREAGPKALAIAAVAGALADVGDIPDALSVVSTLDSAPRDIVAGERDRALTAIVDAQLKAHDPKEALTTSLKITDPRQRVDALRKLATIPVN